MSQTFSDAKIERLVRTFYERVQSDARLSPVFERRIEDWEPHLRRMMAFWTAVLRGEATYHPGPKGPPPAMHRAIAELEPAHFVRWLRVFEEVAGALFEAEAAASLVAKAHHMGRALSAHLHQEPSYRQVRFDVGKIPNGLLEEHRLKSGVRGVLTVVEGSVVFVDEDGSQTRLQAGDQWHIASDTPHHLEDAAAAAVEIAFFRVAPPPA